MVYTLEAPLQKTVRLGASPAKVNFYTSAAPLEKKISFLSSVKYTFLILLTFIHQIRVHDRNNKIYINVYAILLSV